ncbi:hypothetical protein SALBM135S_06610 [Streptomyces alboniger]
MQAGGEGTVVFGDDQGDAEAGGVHDEPGFLAGPGAAGDQGSVGGGVHEPQHGVADGAGHGVHPQIGQGPPPLQDGFAERGAGNHQVQGLLEPGQGGVDDGDVLVGPPAADQADHRLGGGDVERGPASVAFGVAQAAAVVDREGAHHRGQVGEGRCELIADGLGRVHGDHPLFAPAGESAQ